MSISTEKTVWAVFYAISQVIGHRPLIADEIFHSKFVDRMRPEGIVTVGKVEHGLAVSPVSPMYRRQMFS